MTLSVVYLYVFILALATPPPATGNFTRINTGTVLFKECDINRECWSPDDVALLTVRMFLEDIVPDRSSLNIHDNSYVNDLVEYFRLLLDVVRKDTHGKARQITLKALIDTLGGYLYKYVLPTARYSYYAGYINFGSVDKLNKLFEELKCFLRTNGHGWFKSRGPSGVKLPIEPLQVPLTSTDTNPCNTLTVVEGEKKTCIEIPLPFLDSRSDPSSIALPFKMHPLLQIESKAASYILVKYYITGMKCLHYNGANKTEIKRFTSSLHNWIQGQVLPLLNQNKFYSAFGGVLRVMQTLRGMGVQNEKQMGTYNIMPETQLKESVKNDVEETGVEEKKKSDLIMMALLATIFIWFLLGSIFICYRIKAGRYQKGADDKALLSINTCSCKSSSKQTSTSASGVVTSTDSKSLNSKSSSTQSVNDKKRICLLPPFKRRKGQVKNIVCYMEAKGPEPESVSSVRTEQQSLKNSEKAVGFAIQTSFSEGFPGSTSSEDLLHDQIITDYNMDTASTSSQSTI